MSTYLVESEDLTSVANAIRSKSGGNGQLVFPSGFVSEIGNIEQGYSLDQAVQGFHDDIVNIYLPTATTIMPAMFALNTKLESINAPNVTRFGIGDGGNIGSYIFYGCSNLREVNLPKLSDMGAGGYQFSRCTSLVTVHLPSCVTGQHMFNGCTSLKTAVLANQRTSSVQMNGNGFLNCSSLEVVDLSNVNKFNGGEFNGCSKLTTMILRMGTVPNLSNINNFTKTPFVSGGSGGTIYIPKSLYDHLGDGTSSDYQSATNWSTIHGYGTITWAKIEGSIYETQYADGTLINSGSN